MAKPSALTVEVMNAPQVSPIGGLPPRGFAEPSQNKLQAAPKAAPKNDALVQIRCSKAVAKEVKRAAVEAEMTISEFMLVCFHTYMKKC